MRFPDTTLAPSRRLRLALAVAALSLAGAPSGSAGEPPVRDGADPPTYGHAAAVERARTIRAAVNARFTTPHGLVVSEASSTAVIDSFTLLTPPDWDTRVVSAANGIYYAICPTGATCPYPVRRHALPADAFLPRRQALELALRTFAETSADLVVVSLPTRRFVLLVVERDILEHADTRRIMEASTREPRSAADPSLRRLVDTLARPRTFAPSGLEPTPSGRDTMVALPVWPGRP